MIDMAVEAVVKLGVVLTVAAVVELDSELAIGTEDVFSADVGVEVDVVLTVTTVVKLDNELVMKTEDEFSTGTNVELKTMVDEVMEELKLLDNWYKLNPLEPPQISKLFAAHAMLHRPSVAVTLPLLSVFPQ